MNDENLNPYRESDGKGWKDNGPRNINRDKENPDILVPPATDHGTMPNLRFSYSDSHQRLEEGGGQGKSPIGIFRFPKMSPVLI